MSSPDECDDNADICSHRCPHCQALNMFPGFSSVDGCYADDSGSEEHSKMVVLGAFLLDRTNNLRFDER
jgi:hypothetical protein